MGVVGKPVSAHESSTSLPAQLIALFENLIVKCDMKPGMERGTNVSRQIFGNGNRVQV